jgi:competence protein ComEC
MKYPVFGFCVVLMMVAWTGLAERQTERFTFSNGSSTVQHQIIQDAKSFSNTVAAAKRMEVHFIDVGQGDCILIVCPNGKRILVDAGSSTEDFDPEPVRDYLLEQLGSNERIGALVITHPDDDHCNLLPDILEEVKIEHIYLTDDPDEPGEYDEDVENWLREFPPSNRTILTAENYNIPSPKQLDDFGEVKVLVLAANFKAKEGGSTTNPRSIVLKVSFGDIDFLLAGDATKKTENDILKRISHTVMDVECLKIGHHGSTTSTLGKWVEVVRPEVAVATAGWKNLHGHPNREVIKCLQEYTVTTSPHPFRWSWIKDDERKYRTFPKYKEAIYTTSKSGNIVAVTEGKAIDITYDN